MITRKLYFESAEMLFCIYDENDLINRYNPEQLKFIVRDVVDLAGNANIYKIAVITYFRIDPDCRRKGIGRRAMNYLIDHINTIYDCNIIALQSYPLIADYPVEPTGDELNEILAEQAMFFESVGFRNINAFCTFDTSIPYIYINSASKPIIKEIIRIENGCKQYGTHFQINESVFNKLIKGDYLKIINKFCHSIGNSELAHNPNINIIYPNTDLAEKHIDNAKKSWCGGFDVAGYNKSFYVLQNSISFILSDKLEFEQVGSVTDSISSCIQSIINEICDNKLISIYNNRKHAILKFEDDVQIDCLLTTTDNKVTVLIGICFIVNN